MYLPDSPNLNSIDRLFFSVQDNINYAQKKKVLRKIKKHRKRF